MMPPRRASSLILWFIVLIIVVAFATYLYINADKYIELLKISPLAVFFLVLLSLPVLFINGLSNTYLFCSLEAKLSYREGFYLAAASALANQLPVSGGIVSKGIYLKQKHRFPYTKFLSLTLALFFCFVSVDGFIGIAILFYWVLYKKVVNSILFVGFALMASLASIFFLPVERIKIPKKLYRWVSQAIDGWTIIRKNPKLVMKLIGLQIAVIFLLALRYTISFGMLSQSITLTEAMLFSTASILTQLVSLAPGGLGVREALVGAVASILGFDFSISIVAVGLDRLITTPVILVVGGISAVILGKQLSKADHTSKSQD